MVTTVVRYALQSDAGASERLRFAAKAEGAEAAKFARPKEVELDTLQRDALTVLARHCGEPANGPIAGNIQFRWRDGGEYVDDWVQGNQLFVSGYMEGYLNKALDIVGRSLPMTSIPVTFNGNGDSGVLRRSDGKYTAVVHRGDTNERHTSRDATAVGAVTDAALFLSAK